MKTFNLMPIYQSDLMLQSFCWILSTCPGTNTVGVAILNPQQKKETMSNAFLFINMLLSKAGKL